MDRTPAKFRNDFPVFRTPDAYDGSVDLIIDFSHPGNLEAILSYATRNLVPTLIATTGLSEAEMQAVLSAGQTIPILYAPNTSLGVSIINRILREYSPYLSDGFDIEIVEKHHNQKSDAPSGTAKLFASTINSALGGAYTSVHGRFGHTGPRGSREIGVHSVRGGAIAGEHVVVFAGEQEIIEIKHTALSKSLFAQDALRLCRQLVSSPRGAYTVDDIYGSNLNRR
jgi:4-hydroxy-tetrahydrodipicolinate reductase